MTSAPFTAAADVWWARDFACSPRDLRPERARVQQHTGELSGAPGIWILVAGGAPLISLPLDVVAPVSGIAQAWTVSDVLDVIALRAKLASVCPRPITKLIGPAWLAYGSSESLDLSNAPLALPISSPEAIERLRSACDPAEWEHGGSEPSAAQNFGVVDSKGELLALAGYEIWNDSLAHISVITHPQHRGRGFGRAAVAHAAAHALSTGLLPQYRALAQNAASRSIAKRLGFVDYGFSVYFRLGARE